MRRCRNPRNGQRKKKAVSDLFYEVDGGYYTYREWMRKLRKWYRHAANRVRMFGMTPAGMHYYYAAWDHKTVTVRHYSGREAIRLYGGQKRRSQ